MWIHKEIPRVIDKLAGVFQKYWTMLNLCYLTSTHRVMSTTWLSVQVGANNLKIKYTFGWQNVFDRCNTQNWKIFIQNTAF